MRQLLLRATGPFREFGPSAGTLYVLGRLLSMASPRLGLGFYELMAQPVPEQPLLRPNRAQYLRGQRVEPGHPALAKMPVPAKVIAARFAQGAECLVVYRQQEMMGYIWFGVGRYLEDEVRVTYELADPQRTVFDFDLYVLPEHRMGLGFMAVWHVANEYLRERGIVATLSRITRFNLGSRRAHARLGARCIGRMWFLKLGRLELILATVRPWLAWSLSERGRPRLRLGTPGPDGA